MGLNFSHTDFSWGYGRFGEFRRRLAKEIGLILDEMQGFGGSKSWAGIDDDIVILLHHSDCDGHFTPDECTRVAVRLRELVWEWPDDDGTLDRFRALGLADGMLHAAADKVNFEFC